MTESLLEQTQDDQIEEFDATKNYLEELVGENKKFKDTEALAKGKYQSDLFVKTLTRQMDELRADHQRLQAEYNARAKLEEVLEKLTSKDSMNSAETHNANDMNTKPSIDPKEIETLVSSKLQEYDLTKKQQDNLNLVKAKLQERYGENYKRLFAKDIERLGLTDEYVNSTAKTYPQAIIALIPSKQAEDNFQTPPQNNLRAASFAPRKGEVRNMAFYQKMRKEDPARYRDPKTTVQMHKDAIALGEAFYK
jgi:hypothetical protein